MLQIFVLIVLVFSAPTLLDAKPESDADLKLREQMVQISHELGVTCTYCHNSQNFKETSNKNFQIAKEHIRITQLLNSEKGLNAKPSVSCYTCHQGHAKYEYLLPPGKK